MQFHTIQKPNISITPPQLAEHPYHANACFPSLLINSSSHLEYRLYYSRKNLQGNVFLSEKYSVLLWPEWWLSQEKTRLVIVFCCCDLNMTRCTWEDPKLQSWKIHYSVSFISVASYAHKLSGIKMLNLSWLAPFPNLLRAIKLFYSSYLVWHDVCNAQSKQKKKKKDPKFSLEQQHPLVFLTKIFLKESSQNKNNVILLCIMYANLKPNGHEMWS